MEDAKRRHVQEYYKKKYRNRLLVQKYKANRCNVLDRIIDNLSKRTNNCIGTLKDSHGATHMDILGCNKFDLKIHIERQFTANMSFDNYGEWEIDHIYPVSAFDISDWDQALKCFNYANLQPLWKKDNRHKSNKI